MRVIFKKFDTGEIIAFFPDNPWDQVGNLTSYIHEGQHGAASQALFDELELATKKEYMPLLSELKNLVGYKNLIICKK